MSYAASLLATYPASYGPTNLLSDDFVQRTSYDNLYPSKVPYMSSGRLLSDDLAFNQLNYDSKAYGSSIYPLPNSQAVYSKPVATNQRKFPPHDSFASLNDISEYSDSLATASHTNTASSMARSIDGPMNNPFSNYNPLLNNDNDGGMPPGQSIWNSPKAKSKGPVHEIKGKPTTRTNPPTISQKKPPEDEFDNDITPVQSPRQHNVVPKNASLTEMTKPSPAIDIQAWVNDTEKVSTINEKAAEQAWSIKIDQLHQAQAQREKDKVKASRALPIPPKKVDTKHKPTIDPKSRDTTYQTNSESYFDSLFDGDYFRKSTSNDYSIDSSLLHSTSNRKKFTNNSFGK